MDHEGNDSAFDDATWPDVVHVAKYAFLHHATRNRVVMWRGCATILVRLWSLQEKVSDPLAAE